MSRKRASRASATEIHQPAQGLGPRREALNLIGRVLDDGAMLAHGEAEATRLAGLVLRRLGQIDDALSRFVDRMPPAPGAHVLRLLAGELLFAGTAPHAAVDSAVRLARSSRRTARLAGMVNAVGRRLSEQGSDIVANQDPAMNMPDWQTAQLEADWGEAVAHQIAMMHLEPAPHDLCVKIPADRDALARELDGASLPGNGLRLKNRPQISALPGFVAGAWWVQDAAAQIPARLLGDVAGRPVLDICAAPGGKTMQLAAAGGQVTALDISASRLDRLRENLARTGLNADVVEADMFDWEPEQPLPAILLDAPCSATGTLRRHPDLARRGAPDMRRLTRLQAGMLRRAFSWLAPGGVLVYATCALGRAEGEDQISRFLSITPEAARLPLSDADCEPAFITAEGDLRTRPDHWPEHGGLDGFFAARITRKP